MERSVAWSRKGSRAVVVVPKTRAKTTTILGATSPFGVHQTAENTKGGTVTGHYFNFIASTLDILDQHEKYIEQRDYGCVYLPAYSPELNPIEQLWSVYKSKLKREELLEEETLSSRIGDACNKILK
ncbi:hypothetical protein G6F70_006988 [Rhizopus microsporus]|nr:hypothetical protein G6F71_005978 [Rhizopus microsporus]KAG1197006.1 hypothetical protein G6F70_006988 [Rhizopus microsporus]KAG1210341.1 hypothetical protein G6F69_005575 [Rhizopus microsporus]KAG1232046.1 hypothetical protein G6F67_005314 [Rhizopus microsporus]KAG1258542.1 hypothetical protein G6F68_008712 [Rhizopus microsporus]